MIGNAHIDPVWLWEKSEGMSEIKSTFRSVLDRMKEFDDFYFSCACAGYYEWIERIDPDMFAEIKERVKEGRWEITGGFWIQPDCNMPCGESFARHALYSQCYFAEKFGVTAKTGYNVDSFGHNGMMPQILRQSGMENYVYMRPSDKENPSLAENLFFWESPDGSRVLSYRLPQEYSTKLLNESEALEEKYNKAKEIAAEKNQPQMLFYGVGNHGGGPTIRALKQLKGYIAGDKDAAFSTVGEYLKNAKSEGLTDKIPTVKTDLQHHAIGCYSSMSAVKAANRRAENRLAAAEKLNVLSNRIAGTPDFSDKIKKGWLKVAFNQFHDIITGCCIKSAYENALDSFSYACACADDVTELSLHRISWQIKTTRFLDKKPARKDGWILWGKEGEGAPIVVFNPHSFPISVPVRIGGLPLSGVFDRDAVPVPFQVIKGQYNNRGEGSDTLFIAEVPALGYTVYYVFKNAEVEKADFKNRLKTEDFAMENSLVRLEFDKRTGAVKSFFDKEEMKELCGGEFAAALVADDYDSDTWAHDKTKLDKFIGRFTDAEVKVLESGPVRAVTRVTSHYGKSVLVQDFCMYPGKREIEVSCKLDFNEHTKIVKLKFDTAAENTKAIYSMPFGFLKKECTGNEEPSQKWMAITDGDGYGLAVVNDSKYSFSADGGSARMAIARTAAFADHYGDPTAREDYMDCGVQYFKYGISPYSAEKTDRIVKFAEVLNQPPYVIMETHHDGKLENRFEGIRVSAENVSVSALKRSEDNKGYILRFYETCGKKTAVKIEIPFLNAEISAEMQPQQVLTYHISDDGKTVAKTDFTEML